MPHEEENKRAITEALVRRVDGGADASQIATAVAQAMGAIELSLRPIIGKGGVVAMYRRSLLIVASSYPWLSASDSARSAIDLGTLRSLLAERSPSDAAAAGGALLQTFVDLLASLVGKSLTERLLRNVWSDF